jgi:branched-chain amino acid transport system substrate-binding protein
VLARWLGFAGLAGALLAVSGCGGTGTATTNDAVGNQLAVYSSLPLQGPWAGISQQIVGGEKLALSGAGGRAGPFKVGYVSLDDSNPASARWSPGVTLSNAKTAAQDPATIAYLGDFDSAATALSLPFVNGAGILQISPASPYVGLTQSVDAGQDEPERFYPSGHRTFARLQPGDPVEAGVQVRLMRRLGIHRLYVLDDQDPFALPLAQLVATDATQAGIHVVGQDQLSLSAEGAYTGEAEKIAESAAQAVFFSGSTSEGAASLWRQLHEVDPHLLLLGPSVLANETFAAGIAGAGDVAYLTTPALPVHSYPPAARRVLAAYRRQFGSEGQPWALYGYESMSLVLDAIRSAGSRGNDRQLIVEKVLSTHHRRSVLGTYSIEADGEPTLDRYAVDRVSGGQLVPWTVMRAGR